MTRFLTTMAMTILLLMGAGPLLAEEGAERTEFRVEGMTCGLCSKAIEKSLLAVEGVRSVAVDRAAERVSVVGDASLTAAQLEHAIESAGGFEAELLASQ